MSDRTGVCSNCGNPEARHDYCDNCGHGDPLQESIDAEITRLREENARLRENAERYRWLVSRARSEMAMDRWRGYMWGINGIHDPDCKGFVAAIDAAMREAK